MAAYFQRNSEIQTGGDGLQTLILMNPAYVGYPDNHQQPGNNFVFLNSNTAAGDGHNLPHAQPSNSQHFVGIPLHGSASASHQETQQKDVSSPYGFLAYNLYNLQAELPATRDVTRAQQGLSLSLSSQQSLGYGCFRPGMEGPSQPHVAGGSQNRGGTDEVRVAGESPSSASAVSNGVTGVQSVLFSSKYLKAAQDLLDEVVNVGECNKNVAESSKTAFNNNIQTKNVGDSPSSAAAAAAAASGDAPSGGDKRSADLTTAERQEIQMKKAKLVNMLFEVDHRYRHYNHQMHSVIAWFEQNAGIGSAKTYTALALQTISKQFRCLKDAILNQIRTASRSLGEDENFEGKTEGSRLKYVDNQIRQQRALQQLGMLQQNAWRPQRGLPERSVSVLRAWLFEHFLHPYPKDSDKLMLAKQTGLTRSQVSNWFINARVRLWKPMVEEMYMEEVKELGKNGTEETTRKKEQNDDYTSKSAAVRAQTPVAEIPNNNPNLHRNPSISAASTSPSPSTMNNFTGFNLIASSGLESITQSSPKKLRIAAEVLHSPVINIPSKSTNEEKINMAMKLNLDNRNREVFTLLGAPTNFIGGFGSYSIGELERFTPEQYPAPYSGNGVSLTLGLPHSHCDKLSIQRGHQSFISNQMGRGVDIGDNNNYSLMNPPAGVHSTNVYENIRRKGGFSGQLLPDFVARKSITDFAMGME